MKYTAIGALFEFSGHFGAEKCSKNLKRTTNINRFIKLL